MPEERFVRTRLISHLFFVVAAIPVLSSQPTPDVWASYAPINPGQNECSFMTVPNVTGLIIVEAQLAIDAAGLDYFFYDQFSNQELSIVPPDAVVIRQSPLRDKYWCPGEKIQLTIDTSLRRSTDSATSMPPEDVTPDTRGTKATTTIPAKSSTTTIPKATTTTSP
jgi:beta-lactam-binding protein with PASTA domain